MLKQDQYSVLRQPTRRLHIKLNLLNANDRVVDSLEGIATEGNINISSTSSYRRSGSITMVLDEKYNLAPNPTSKIWFDKRCSIEIGVENYSGRVIWFNMGRFAIDEAGLNFDISQNTIFCQLKDYMALIDGNLGGNIPEKVEIPANESTVSEAIRTAASKLGNISIENIIVEGKAAKVPYTIEKSVNTTTWDIIKELIDLYMGWDCYYNADGYFIVERIRDKENDAVMEVFDKEDKDFTITSNSNINFKNVRNSIYIWGRQLDNGEQIKWTYRNRWSRETYSDLALIADKAKGDICHIKNENISYLWDGSVWKPLDFKVIPMFNIEEIGEKIWSTSDDKIFDEAQAKTRAEYELNNYSNFAETVNFSCVPLYYLKVNDKIHINSDITGDYLIQSISVPLDISSPMNITARKLYY